MAKTSRCELDVAIRHEPGKQVCAGVYCHVFAGAQLRLVEFHLLWLTNAFSRKRHGANCLHRLALHTIIDGVGISLIPKTKHEGVLIRRGNTTFIENIENCDRSRGDGTQTA